MPANKQGKFITIEGSEGAGKSTLIAFVRDYLAKFVDNILLTREPGGTPIAERIRSLLLEKSEEQILPQTELLLLFAGRAQHIQHVILPALTSGTWVISDRYIDATYAYQGGGRGMSENTIKQLDELVSAHCYPDLTLFLDIPVQLGFERNQKIGKRKDRIEEETMQFFERVSEAYRARARANSDRIKVIDAGRALSVIQAEVVVMLDVFLAQLSC